jgi:outer membrane protein assembly factor BamB
MMRVWHYGLVVLSLLLLAGCNTIEHRSETIKKQPLLPLTHHKIEPTLVWSNEKSVGSKKTDARLQLAVTDSLVITADSKGQIFAVDRKTGALRWEIASKADITSGPTVVEGRVLVGTNGAQVLAFQASDGAPLWQANLTAPVLAAPQGNRGKIFVHALDGSVVALNADNGHQLWYYSVQLPSLMLRRASSPVLVDNHVVVGFANGRLIALHRVDGQPDWEQEIGVSKGRSDIQRMVDISADPIAMDNVIYAVTYQGRLIALKADMGEVIWEKPMSSYSGLAVTPQMIFVTDASGVLWAIDRKTGHELWKQADLTGRHLSAPAVIKDLVVVGDDEGYLHWFAQTDGSWMARTVLDKKGIEATPIVKDNQLYVLGQGGKVGVYKITELSSHSKKPSRFRFFNKEGNS